MLGSPLLVPAVDSVPLTDEFDDEPPDVLLDDLLPDVLLVPPEDDVVSLANVMSCAACTPVGDGSLTLITQWL